jgi:hypothetical protein
LNFIRYCIKFGKDYKIHPKHLIILKNMNKATALETLEGFPAEFDIQELIDKLIVVDKVERGLKDIEEGKTMSLSEARRRFEEKWSKS